MGAKRLQLDGQVFGRLTVVCRAAKHKCEGWYWKCRCECGNETTVLGKVLARGDTNSCGCLKRDLTIKRNLDGGRAYGMARSLTHNTWTCMMRRCYDTKNVHYKSYGGRGIRVCVAWHDFMGFIKDMGLRPGRRFTLDRIDNEGNYEPSNCRWATKKEQQRNRRCCRMIECMGRLMTLAEISELSGMPDSTLAARLDKGIPIEEALAYRI